MKLLLFSNSTNFGEPFMHYTQGFIKAFLKDSTGKGLFIPYAAVLFSYDEYFEKVSNVFNSLGKELVPIHCENNPERAIENANFIVIGGGNTFQLLSCLYRLNLMAAIQEKVKSGIPYIGWSAGANIACPGIYTTNDMPIVQPPSFKALNFLSYQINPHYTDFVQPNHGGETREVRIREFLELNNDARVIGLREGTLLMASDGETRFLGPHPAIVFKYNKANKEVFDGEILE